MTFSNEFNWCDFPKSEQTCSHHNPDQAVTKDKYICSVIFCTAYLLQVMGNLEPIPADFAHKARYTLARSPIHRRANTDEQLFTLYRQFRVSCMSLGCGRTQDYFPVCLSHELHIWKLAFMEAHISCLCNCFIASLFPWFPQQTILRLLVINIFVPVICSF